MCPYDSTTANQILNWTMGKANLPAKSKVYIGLSSTNPEGADGSFSEVSYSGYARVLLNQYGETYPNLMASASGREVKNTYQVNWTKTSEDITVVGVGLFETPTGGTPYWFAKADMTEEQEEAGGIQIPAGAVPLFDPGVLKIYFTDEDVTEAAAEAATE